MRPQTVPGMTCRGSGVGRPHSRGSSSSLGRQQQLQLSEAVSSEAEMQSEFEATITEALPQPVRQSSPVTGRSEQ